MAALLGDGLDDACERLRFSAGVTASTRAIATAAVDAACRRVALGFPVLRRAQYRQLAFERQASGIGQRARSLR